MESLKVDNLEEHKKFESVSNQEIIELKAKLEILEVVGGLIDSFREGFTRQLVVNNIKDEDELKKKISDMEIKEYKEDCGIVEP